MIIKIQKLFKDAILPTYAHPDDAGMDLYSREEKILKPSERHIFKTGIAMAIPCGYAGLVWDRSGLAAKEGITTLAGVVDSSYRGEIGVVILNTSPNKVKIIKGERIAQMLIQPVIAAKIKEAKKLNQTQRGTGGFGASGRN